MNWQIFNRIWHATNSIRESFAFGVERGRAGAYCLDAPDWIPAGSMRYEDEYGEVVERTVYRGRA